MHFWRSESAASTASAPCVRPLEPMWRRSPRPSAWTRGSAASSSRPAWVSGGGWQRGRSAECGPLQWHSSGLLHRIRRQLFPEGCAEPGLPLRGPQSAGSCLLLAAGQALRKLPILCFQESKLQTLLSHCLRVVRLRCSIRWLIWTNTSGAGSPAGLLIASSIRSRAKRLLCSAFHSRRTQATQGGSHSVSYVLHSEQHLCVVWFSFPRQVQVNYSPACACARTSPAFIGPVA